MVQKVLNKEDKSVNIFHIFEAMRKSIKGQLILLFILLGLTPMAVIFAIYSPSMLKDLTSQAAQSFHTNGKSQVRLITLWLKGKLKEAELLASSPQIMSCFTPGSTSGLKSIQKGYPGHLQQFLEEKEYVGLYLFDKEGELRASAVEATAVVLPYLNKEALKKTLEGKSFVHRLLPEEKSNHILFITVPVSSLETREVLGALTVGIDTHQARRILENIPLPNAYSLLMDSSGGMVACLASDPDWEGLKMVGQRLINLQTGSLTEGVKACLASGIASDGGKKEGYSPYVYTNHLGQKVFGTWGWVPELGVGIIVEVDARGVFRPVFVIRERLWYLLLIIGVGIVIVAIFTASKLSEPLISLTVVAQRIAQGDLKERADIQSPNEIGEIGRCINLMAESLQEKDIQLSKTKKN